MKKTSMKKDKKKIVKKNKTKFEIPQGTKILMLEEEIAVLKKLLIQIREASDYMQEHLETYEYTYKNK